ncbi:MAG: type III pantothenate kinase [Bacteroidota bacterium]|nr:type III pantothenate kinase [Bacteroidota bacterium]
MQLVIDIGNTRIKAAVFNGNLLQEHFIFNTKEEFLEGDLFTRFSIQNCILCTVVDGLEPFIDTIKKAAPLLLFTSSTQTPLINRYKSAHTLGSDRLAAAAGANALYPQSNLLVIDAGTCIKYNFVSHRNEYIGGAISPGLKMRFKALNTFTSRLPLLDVDDSFDTLTGMDSSESILSGVLNGAVAEVQGLIELYRDQYPDITVILTGGDVNFFEKRLKKPIFADSFLILKGLNSILAHNLKSGISQ